MSDPDDRARGGTCRPSGRRPRRKPAAVRPLAPLLKALGDPTRLEIVALLAAHGDELCACEIEARFALSQATVSHHLRVLREAGVVSAERRGTWVHYALREEALDGLRACVDALEASRPAARAARGCS